MAKNKTKISADSIESFNIISESIGKLPPAILSQIELAEFGLMGITCWFRKSYETAPKVYLPPTTMQITYFEDYIGVYAGEYFFKLPDINAKYTYLIIQPS